MLSTTYDRQVPVTLHMSHRNILRPDVAGAIITLVGERRQRESKGKQVKLTIESNGYGSDKGTLTFDRDYSTVLVTAEDSSGQQISVKVTRTDLLNVAHTLIGSEYRRVD